MKAFYSWFKIAICIAFVVASAISAQAASNLSWTVYPNPENTQKQIFGVFTINIPSLEDDGIFMVRPNIILDLPDGTTKGFQLNIGDNPGQIKFNVTEKLTQSGKYVFTIEEGSLLNGWTRKELPEIKITYTVDSEMIGDGTFKISRALNGDKLEGSYTITFLDYAESGVAWYNYLIPSNVYLYKASEYHKGGRLYKYWPATSSRNTVTFTVEPGFGEAGDYILDVEGWIDPQTEEDIPTILIPFTLTGAEIILPDPEPEPVVDWTYIVTPDPEIAVSEFPSRIFVEWPGITSLNNFSSLIEIAGPNNYKNTTTRIKNCYRLSSGENAGRTNMGYIDRPATLPPYYGEYTITIPKYTILDEKTDKYCDEIKFTYTVSKSGSVIVEIGDKANYNIYRLNGSTVATDAPADAVRNLTPGFYIINGKTYLISH